MADGVLIASDVTLQKLGPLAIEAVAKAKLSDAQRAPFIAADMPLLPETFTPEKEKALIAQIMQFMPALEAAKATPSGKDELLANNKKNAISTKEMENLQFLEDANYYPIMGVAAESTINVVGYASGKNLRHAYLVQAVANIATLCNEEANKNAEFKALVKEILPGQFASAAAGQVNNDPNVIKRAVDYVKGDRWVQDSISILEKSAGAAAEDKSKNPAAKTTSFVPSPEMERLAKLANPASGILPDAETGVVVPRLAVASKDKAQENPFAKKSASEVA